MIKPERLRTMQQKLYRIQYSINDSQKFPNMLSSIPPLQEDEEDLSFAVADVLIPYKPIFYYRFVVEIYSRRKLGDNVLFDQ